LYAFDTRPFGSGFGGGFGTRFFLVLGGFGGFGIGDGLDGACFGERFFGERTLVLGGLFFVWLFER